MLFRSITGGASLNKILLIFSVPKSFVVSICASPFSNGTEAVYHRRRQFSIGSAKTMRAVMHIRHITLFIAKKS